MRRWWIAYLDVCQREIDALEELGYHYNIDQSAYDDGRLVINIDYIYNGQTIPLVAKYPGSYPYFMPTVSANTLALEHHQNPFGGNLCLLDQGGRQWNPGNDTLASMLREMFPEIQKANSSDSGERNSAKQELIAEPLSAFVPYLRPSAIIHSGFSPPTRIESGTLSLKVAELPKEAEWMFTFGAIETIKDMAGNVIDEFPIAQKLNYTRNVTGYWYRLPNRPIVRDLETLKSQVLTNMPIELRQRLPMGKDKQFVIAVTYEDEIAHDKRAMDWLFFIARLEFHSPNHDIICEMYPIAGDTVTQETLQTRTPELKPLADKRVLVVGLGSLGSPLVMELARAGVNTLVLIDHDTVSIGNSVRWALGWRAHGNYKGHVIQHEISQQYPNTNVTAHVLRIGEPPMLMVEGGNEYRLDSEILEKALEQSDLVIDASAEDRVQHYLADLCEFHKKPYLWLSTTHGGWGGRIGRVIPRTEQGCFHCAIHHSIDNEELIPPEKENDALQARGCADETFTGSGIDASTISLLASRLAIATLCRGHENSYPDFDWNLAIIRLRNTSGDHALFPEAITLPLAPHPNCRCQQLKQPVSG